VIDAYASLPHFLTHLAPLRRVIDRLWVPPSLSTSPAILGLDSSPIKGTMRREALGGSRTPLVVASYQDYTRVRGFGRPIVYLEHGYGQTWLGSDHPSYPGGKGKGDVSLFLCPNERVAEANRRAYPNAEVAVVGSPRVEHLARLRGDGGETVAFGWHWNCTQWEEAKSTFLEYRDAVARAAARWPSVGHGHPKDWNRLAEWYARKGIRSEWLWDNVVREAGVYVCDGSSTIYEACAIGLPVVLLNGRTWRRDVHHGMRYWEWADVGPTVNHPAELEPAIFEVICADRWGERRSEVALEAFGPLEGATERAVEAIRRL